ncbi:MAG: hypothetical protein Q4G04_00155 [bacterium]|nr:hypothetical protein [bacterium]
MAVGTYIQWEAVKTSAKDIEIYSNVMSETMASVEKVLRNLGSNRTLSGLNINTSIVPTIANANSTKHALIERDRQFVAKLRELAAEAQATDLDIGSTFTSNSGSDVNKLKFQ